MSEGSKERSPQQLAKSRRDYLAQVKMLTVDERTQEAAKINKTWYQGAERHRCCGDSGCGPGRLHSAARLSGQ
jgi:hypothetical protein